MRERVPTRLHGEDAAWLHMDDATNPMVVSGLLELADVLPEIRARELARRLTAFLPFAARVVEPRLPFGTPEWQPIEQFDAAEHIERVRLDTNADADLRAFVGKTLSARLDSTKPLWRLYLVDRPDRGTTLLFRVHHAMADGYALLGVLHALSDDAPVLGPRPPPPSVSRLEYGRRLAKAAARLLRLPPDHPTLLQRPLGGEKLVAWSKPIALAEVKKIGAASRGTVNDVLASVVAGALRRYLTRRGESCEALELHAMVPVDLRTQAEDAALANRFGLVILGLPMGIVDPMARISAVHHRMGLLKGSAEAKAAQMLLSALGYASTPVENAVTTYFGRKASLVFTNLIGPRAPATLAGIRIERMMFWVPEAARLGLGISVFSYAGEIRVCILSDAAVIADPETLVADVEAELAVAA